MIMDKQLLASDAQTVLSSAVSTNAIDLGAARDVGRGQAIRALAVVSTAFAGGTSVRADLVESNDPALASPSVIATGATIATANAGQGARLADIVIPATTKRYVGFSYVISGSMSAGKITAGLVLDSDSGGQFAGNTGF